MIDPVERSMNRIAGSECDQCHKPRGGYHEYHCPFAIRDELASLTREFNRVRDVLTSKNDQYRNIARCLNNLIHHLNEEFDMYDPEVEEISPERQCIVEDIRQLREYFEMLDTYI